MPFAPLLHSGHAVTWSSWDLHPTVLGILLVVTGLYIYAWSSGSEPVKWWRVAVFALGATSMVLSLISPLDAAAHRLLSFHMLQHVFLTTIGPPLVLMGLPEEALRRLLPLPLIGAVMRLVTLPVVAAGLFIVNMWVWHVPPIYELSLNHLGVHIVMHFAFLTTGLLFWWPVVRPLPELTRMGEGGRLLYLFVTGFPMGLLALLLIATNTVVYGYYATGPDLWGISPITDQQVAGIIMGALGESASFIAISLLFMRYLDRDEAASDASAATV